MSGPSKSTGRHIPTHRYLKVTPPPIVLAAWLYVCVQSPGIFVFLAASPLLTRSLTIFDFSSSSHPLFPVCISFLFFPHVLCHDNQLSTIVGSGISFSNIRVFQAKNAVFPFFESKLLVMETVCRRIKREWKK